MRASWRRTGKNERRLPGKPQQTVRRYAASASPRIPFGSWYATDRGLRPELRISGYNALTVAPCDRGLTGTMFRRGKSPSATDKAQADPTPRGLAQPVHEDSMPRAVIFKGRQRRCSQKNLVRMLPGKGLAVAQPFRHLRDDSTSPASPRPARAETRAGAICGVPSLSPSRPSPPSPARKTDMGETAGIGILHHLRNHHQRAVRQRLTHRVAVGQRHGRVGAHDPHRLHSPRAMASNSSTAIRPASAPAVRSPEYAPRAEIVRLKVHVRRQLVRQPANFLPPIAFGCPVSENGPQPRTVELPAGKMNVNDGVTLVAAAGGLVDPMV